jgi:hypothetical protein
MKKNPQRLTLSRETLGHLEREQLETAAGASGRPVCCTITASCPPPPQSEGGEATCLC